jgi:hypothetical protein
MQSFVPMRAYAALPAYRVSMIHMSGLKRDASGVSMASTCTPTGSANISAPSDQEPTSPQLQKASSVPSLCATSGQNITAGFEAGAMVTIGEHSFLCKKALGKGSFGEVWEGMEGDMCVAMKDVVCRRAADLEQALLEVSLLRELDGAGSHIPRCLGHSVHRKQDGSSVVRFAMTRLQGVPLEDFLSGKPCLASDSAAVLQLGGLT